MERNKKEVRIVIKKSESVKVTLPKGVRLTIENKQVTAIYNSSIADYFDREAIEHTISQALLPFASFEEELPEDLTVKMSDTTNSTITWQFCASVYTEIKVENALQGIAIMTDVFKE